MVNETIINIDLNDPRSSEIAEVLGNKTCKNILNLIAQNELTETDISLKLKIPLNTVDYNIKKLIKTGLIESTSHFWSTRGKRIPTYKIANKKIVISPSSFKQGIFVLPTVFLAGAIAIGIKFFNFTKETVENTGELMMAKSADTGIEMASLAYSAPVPEVVVTKTSFLASLSGVEWFLVGVWISSVLFLLLNYRRYKNESK